MEHNNSLVEIKKEKKGLNKAISSMIELIKSKLNKDYVLSNDSPEFLKKNRNLIIKTIRKDCKYLNQVPDSILLEELQQKTVPVDGIIDTAFKEGYRFPVDSRRRKISNTNNIIGTRG